jgi:hypothetical protein
MIFMGYYLVDNPNPYAKQYSEYRNGKLSGGVLLHTTESPKGRGALPIANWIATQRRDYGSYHAIFDADTTILLAPDNYTVWHCAANGFNSTTMGVSWACRTSDLDPADEWTRKAFKRCAVWLVDFWKRNNMDPLESARFIPAPDTRNRPGLTTHGDAQPVDRSDAFTRHPKRAELEKLLIGYVIELVEPKPIPGQDCKMKRVIMRNPKTGEIAVFWQDLPWRVRLTAKQVEVYRYFGVEYKGDVDPFFFDTSVRLQNGA